MEMFSEVKSLGPCSEEAEAVLTDEVMLSLWYGGLNRGAGTDLRQKPGGLRGQVRRVREIFDGKDVRVAGAQPLIHPDTAEFADRQSGRRRQSGIGTHTDRGHHHLGRQSAAVGQHHCRRNRAK